MKKLLASLSLGLIAMSASSVSAAAAVTWADNGHEYAIISSPSTSWANARQAAMNLGAGWDLVTITSAKEQMFIADLIGPSNGSLVEYYIGGKYENGAWGWVTNEAFSYTYFGNGEPNGNANEPYLALDGRYNTPNWGWNDYTGAGASFVAGYVAEKHIASPVPEADTMAMLSLGLVGLVAYTRRKRRAA